MTKSDNTINFISARPIRSLDKTWLIETDRYFTFISNLQISALIPKQSPYLTGGYWDDISFAGICSNQTHKYLVLGAGIGSFLPLLNKLNPHSSVTCVEINSEVSCMGNTINQTLSSELSPNINWVTMSAEDLEQTQFDDVDSVFIDLYKKDGVSEIALSDLIHKKIIQGMNNDTLVYINVYDQLWGKVDNTPTAYFMNELSKFYPTIGLFRRNAQSTIICSRSNEASVKTRIKLMLSKLPLDYQNYYSTITSTLHFPNYVSEKIDFDLSLLKFSEQKSVTNEDIKIGSEFLINNLSNDVASEISTLSDFDLIKLSRRTSEILNNSGRKPL